MIMCSNYLKHIKSTYKMKHLNARNHCISATRLLKHKNKNYLVTKSVRKNYHIYNKNFKDDAFGTHYVVTCFLYKLDKKVIITRDRQHADLKWFSINDIEQNTEIHQYVKNYLPNVNKLLRSKRTTDGKRSSLLR